LATKLLKFNDNASTRTSSRRASVANATPERARLERLCSVSPRRVNNTETTVRKDMTSRSLLLAGAALVFGAVGYAYINPKAPSASHALEAAAVDLHDYTHQVWPSSYGAHPLEVESTELHSTLHGWQHGTASECDVSVERDDVTNAYQSMQTQFIENGVLRDEGTLTRFIDTTTKYAMAMAFASGAGC
jgi:hypothetical protein